MPANPLTMCEREEIRVGICRGETDGVIAGRLGRCRTTINREINRNGGRVVYSAAEAQARAVVEARRPKVPKLVADVGLAAHVSGRLRAKDSPMTIAIELARGVHGITAALSHESIYTALYAHGRRGLAKGLHKHLHRQRRCRKRRLPSGETPARPGPLGAFQPITARPEAAEGRGEVGHLEGDLILGSFNRSALVTVFDRASRYLWLADLPNGHSATDTLAALIELIERIPQRLRRSLTWDQGREMAAWEDLQTAVDISVFFADPHAPWQRPTNENGNGLIRRYVGKGTDLNIYTPDDLRAIEHRLNTMPRRSLDWNTANAVYAQAVAMTG